MNILNYDKFLEMYIHNYPFTEANDNNTINLAFDKEFKDIIYTEPSKESIQFLNKFLKKDSKNKFIKLYHGTHPDNNILEDGLLVTTAKRRKSYQSESGYTYFSIFPDMAKTFGNIGNGISNAIVYEVTIPLFEIKPDKDQIVNVIQNSNKDLKFDLGTSALYGHGFRVKGDIPPYMIRVYEN